MNTLPSVAPRSASGYVKYRPLFQLGAGGMANVVLAVVQGPGGFNKLQVVKQLRADLATEPEFTAMFLDEARLSARINHHNVVQTNEVGHDGECYFIAMEYLEGESLEALLRRARTKLGGLPLGMTLRILCDALEGLHHAHDLTDFDGSPLHVVHRDVSPQNLFVTYDGVTKVLDFGIAKAADSSGVTRTGVIKGKFAYMAPEQLRRGKPVERKADIFAIGAILWRAITGQRLWKGMSDLDVFQELTRGAIPSPESVQPDAEPELVAICNKCLAIEPADRFPTAGALQDELEGYIRRHNLQVDRREIGKLLSSLFASRRTEVKQAIELRLREAAQSPTFNGTDVPALPGVALTNSTMSGEAAPLSLTGDGLPRATLEPSALMASMPAASVRTDLAPAQPGRSWGFIALVAVLALTTFAATFAIERARLPGPAPTKPAVEQATLSVSVSPESAQVFVDDEPVATKQAQVTRGGAKHWVRAQANGYVPQAKLVECGSAACSVAISLDKSPAAGH